MDVEDFIKELIKIYSDQKGLLQNYYDSLFSLIEINVSKKIGNELGNKMINELRNLMPGEVETLNSIYPLLQKYAFIKLEQLIGVDNLPSNCKFIPPKRLLRINATEILDNLIKGEICVTDNLRKVGRSVNNADLIKIFTDLVIRHEKHLVRLRKLWDEVASSGEEIF